VVVVVIVVVIVVVVVVVCESGSKLWVALAAAPKWFRCEALRARCAAAVICFRWGE
jgi:hypothetical protein